MDSSRLTNSEKSELIRLVRRTMGESHPTGERVVGYLKDGHRNLAVRALQESVNGLRELIEMDADDGDDLSEVASDEVKSEDQQDLDKYEMLLNAIKES